MLGSTWRGPRSADMDFELPEELRLLKETVRNFVDRELIPVEMTSMDGPKMRPRSARRSRRRRRSSGCGISTCRRSMAARASTCSASSWCGRRSRAPSRCRRAGPSVFGPDLRPILFTLNDRAEGEVSASRCCAARRSPRSRSRSPTPAPIPARCGPRRCARAITTSSTATSAGSPARPTPISSSSSPRPTAARAAAAACSCSWSTPTRRASR